MSTTDYVDLGDPDEIALEDADELPEGYESDTEEEDDENVLDEESEQFLQELIKRTLVFCEVLSDTELRPYQIELGERIIRGLILADGEVVTALFARQSGKSETVAVIIAGVIILFPKLAHVYSVLERFKKGVWVGLFAPGENQSDFVFSRIVDKLTSDHAKEILADPELDIDVDPKTKVIKTSTGSIVRRQTANPKAKIEGATYHINVIDEAQDTDDMIVSKSISPMLASTAGPTVKIGTPSFHKGNFYRDIQFNKRRQTSRRIRNHFEANYKVVSKYNPFYAKFIKQEKLRIGEDSDEFQMCVAPETKVLTADLRHVPAREVYRGMELVGFDEDRPAPGAHRRFRKTVVEAVKTVSLPSYLLTLSDGTTITCSEDHLWLVSTAGRRTTWKRTSELATSDRIFKLTEVWDHERTYETGYLSAAFDGEGHLSHEPLQLGFSQKENPLLDGVRKYLAELGFSPSETENAATGVHRLNICGKAEMLRFLGQVRPQRLLGKLDIDRLGSIGRHDRRTGGFDHPQVTGKVFLGDQDVVAFRTSTRTFVAEGLASHNSYNLKWLLDRGMLIGEDELDVLADKSMGLVRGWVQSPVVVGIDPARTNDSTVVTVVWVDWDHPDPAGYREHRVLNWLEINNTDWEAQYSEIIQFLANYDVAYVGVDAQGMGGPVAERLGVLMGHRCEVMPITSDIKAQTERWTHLIQLLQRNMLIYPGHSKARRTRVWKRFRQQMEDAEKRMQGQYMLVAAPDDARSANDDYVDSLALACLMSKFDTVPEVEVVNSDFYG